MTPTPKSKSNDGMYGTSTLITKRGNPVRTKYTPPEVIEQSKAVRSTKPKVLDNKTNE